MSLLSSLTSLFRGEKRVSSSEFEHAVNEVLLANTVADSTRKHYPTEEGSLAISAVWACVRTLSETVGTLPIHLYHKTTSGVTAMLASTGIRLSVRCAYSSCSLTTASRY